MVFDLQASTDNAVCAVFDPQALAHLLAVPCDEIWNSARLAGGLLDRQIAEGNLMTFDPAADGTYLFRFYVGEPAPAELLAQAQNSVKDALLRVPSGNLCAVGREDLPNKDLKLRGIEDYTTGPLGQIRGIQPGNYSVAAYNFCSTDSSASNSSWFSCDLGCLLLVGLPLVGLLCYLFEGQRWAMVWLPLALGVALAACLIRRAYFWAGRKLGRIPPLPPNFFGPPQPPANLPAAVFVLTLLPDDADISKMKGLGLGVYD